MPEEFRKINSILNGKGPERTHRYVRTRVHDKIEEGFLKGDGDSKLPD